jgi:hypothetical protein
LQFKRNWFSRNLKTFLFRKMLKFECLDKLWNKLVEYGKEIRHLQRFLPKILSSKYEGQVTQNYTFLFEMVKRERRRVSLFSK